MDQGTKQIWYKNWANNVCQEDLLEKKETEHLPDLELCHVHLMKKHADKGRTECNFQVGDHVLLKLQPYCQSYVTKRVNYKLAFRFFRPFAGKVVPQVLIHAGPGGLRS
jgi:hypothetical protein